MQELEAAVSCKYVAANAVNALQQVYQVLSNTSPSERATAQQAWARILLKPELRRVAEACHILEQTALDSIKSGGTYQQAKGVCVRSQQTSSGPLCTCMTALCGHMHFRQ